MRPPGDADKVVPPKTSSLSPDQPPPDEVVAELGSLPSWPKYLDAKRYEDLVVATRVPKWDAAKQKWVLKVNWTLAPYTGEAVSESRRHDRAYVLLVPLVPWSPGVWTSPGPLVCGMCLVYIYRNEVGVYLLTRLVYIYRNEVGDYVPAQLPPKSALRPRLTPLSGFGNAAAAFLCPPANVHEPASGRCGRGRAQRRGRDRLERSAASAVPRRSP